MFIRLNNNVLNEGFLVKTAAKGQILTIMLSLKLFTIVRVSVKCSQSLVQLGTVFNEIKGVLKLKSYWIVASVILVILTGFLPLTFIVL